METVNVFQKFFWFIMSETNPQNLPEHVAIIMDGNGRWAKRRTLNRIRGHEAGAESVREIVRASREIGISWLTMYAFSEENWKRPKIEVQALMRLLNRFLKSELDEMMQNGIRFQTIGRTEKLPPNVQKTIFDTVDKTSTNSGMTLTLALSYGGRQELVDAVRNLYKKVESGALGEEEIDDRIINECLYTSSMPDPDLLIRTSGEYRVSNFLLWQIAYSELYFTSTLWPDFRKEEYLLALEAFQNRDRRFGRSEGKTEDGGRD